MDNEKDLSALPDTNTEDDNSLDRSVQVEQILEFYKDKEPVENTDDSDTKNNKFEILKEKLEIIKPTFVSLKKKIIDLLNKVPHINIETEKAEPRDGIETHSFGLGEKGKMFLYRIISAIISIAIITLSFVLAIYLPGNDEIIAQRQEELRADDEYVSIKSRHDTIKNEVDELTVSNTQKEETLKQISDIDNTKAELRTQINEKKYELSNLNSTIAEKRNAIASLDANIASIAPAETVYTPGKYTVGKHFAAGKYYITGTGKFMVATSAGKSKINISLGSTPVEVELENNDIVKFDSKVKFTSAY